MVGNSAPIVNPELSMVVSCFGWSDSDSIVVIAVLGKRINNDQKLVHYRIFFFFESKFIVLQGWASRWTLHLSLSHLTGQEVWTEMWCCYRSYSEYHNDHYSRLRPLGPFVLFRSEILLISSCRTHRCIRDTPWPSWSSPLISLARRVSDSIYPPQKSLLNTGSLYT